MLVFGDDSDLGILAMDRERTSTLVLQSEFIELNAAISPDGRLIAYQSDESGQFEVYVRPFPDVDTGRWQVSSAGGRSPLWNPDGQELFYVGPQEVMAVSFDSDPTFTVRAVTQLFDIASYGLGNPFQRRIAVAPDGQRFLLLKMGGQGAAPPQITVVLNWFEELQRLVPSP